MALRGRCHITSKQIICLEKSSCDVTLIIVTGRTGDAYRCSGCVDRLEKGHPRHLARAPGADRTTRMNDISSDEEDVSSSR